MLYLFIVIVAIVSAYWGAYVADEKGRSTTEGFIFGSCLGPLGVLVIALLPNQPPGSNY